MEKSIETLFCKELGENNQKNLIFLHGFLAAGASFQALYSYFKNDFHIYNIDLRNHGKSFSRNSLDYKNLTEDVEKFCKEKGLVNNLYFVGHSMGGKVAMQYAINNPQACKRLVCLDIAPKLYNPDEEVFKACENLAFFPFEQFQSRKEIAQELRKTIEDTDILTAFLFNLRFDGEKYYFKMDKNKVGYFYKQVCENIHLPISGKIETPSLFFNSGDTRFIQDSERQIIKKYFAQVSFISIPEVSHRMVVEAPEKIALGILDFFKE